jgi:hypothetical protein
MATTDRNRGYRLRPPAIADKNGDVHRIDLESILNRLAVKRIRSGRDLKLIITAQSSQTGVGKTTLAGWLAMSWTKMFTGQSWWCDPENPTDGMATLRPGEYFEIIKQVGPEFEPGTTVIVDDAEELDARRSMQNLNVEFSQRWMLMRLKQAITILTLPSPSSIDSRLEELADVWINVLSRGEALVHFIEVGDYGPRDVLTKQTEFLKFPDVSTHPEMQKLQKMKQEKMRDWDDVDSDIEEVDEEEVERETLQEVAQQMRDDGMTVRDVADKLPRGRTWVSNNTEAES